MRVVITFGARRSGLTAEALSTWRQSKGPALLLLRDEHERKRLGLLTGVLDANGACAVLSNRCDPDEFLRGSDLRVFDQVIVDDYFALDWRQRELVRRWCARYDCAVLRLSGCPTHIYHRADVKRIQAARAAGQQPPRYGAAELAGRDEGQLRRLADEADLWDNYLTWPDVQVFHRDDGETPRDLEAPDPYAPGYAAEQARQAYLREGHGFLYEAPRAPYLKPAAAAAARAQPEGFSFIRKTPFTWIKPT